MSAIETHDALGRPVRLPRTPRRIVSLVPSQTELLADLGLDDAVVGLTKFCVHPADWRRRKAVVGGTKDAKLERIVALEPDLVLANKEENTRAIVEGAAAHAPVYVTDVGDLPGALAMIRAVGALVGRAPAAHAMADGMGDDFAALAREVAGRPGRPPRVAYLIWKGPYMAAGGDTFIDAMLRRGGWVNAFAAAPRYPEVSVDDLRSARLDRLYLSSEPFPFGAKHAAELSAALPGVAVRCVDGEPFTWYGSRLRATPSTLRALG